MEKKDKLQDLKRRLLAAFLLATLFKASGCAKEDSKPRDYDIMPEDSIESYEDINYNTKSDLQAVLDDIHSGHRIIPPRVPRELKYDVLIDTYKLYNPGLPSPYENYEQFAIVNQTHQSTKQNPFDGRYPVIPNYFNDYTEAIEIPDSFNWMTKEDLSNVTDKDEDITVLISKDGYSIYVYRVVTYTFNKHVKSLIKEYNKAEYPAIMPKEGDTITLVLLNTNYNNCLIRLQTGLGCESLNVQNANIGDISSIISINNPEQDAVKTRQRVSN